MVDLKEEKEKEMNLDSGNIAVDKMQESMEDTKTIIKSWNLKADDKIPTLYVSPWKVNGKEQDDDDD